MKQTFLFVRPPRPLWPFNGPGSAFWPPLAFASLAAALRTAIPELNVVILDAPAMRMGWKTLTAELMRLQPDFVGIGEEAVSATEGLRLARLAKQIGATVIAGGCFFGQVAPHVLPGGPIDVVVHGEGEETIVELVAALLDGSSLSCVRGISFTDESKVVRTADRELIRDLDRLPFPAYDLLPVNRYGTESRNHQSLAAIELSRGCAHQCSFCVLWRQMGRTHAQKVEPHLRVKSVDRIVEEIEILTHRFARKYLGWVDPCFNAHPTIPAQVSQHILSRGITVGQSAWVRSDCLVRDHRSGTLATCIEAGLNEVYIGVERLTTSDLRDISKGSTGAESRESLQLLADQYSQVTVVGSIIYGLPSDTPATLRSLFRQAYELPLDIVFFIPLTPLPGTPMWNDDLWEDGLHNVSRMNFLPEAKGDRRLDELTKALFRAALVEAPWLRTRQVLRSLTQRGRRRRSVYSRYLGRLAPFVLRGLWQSLHPDRKIMRLPSWYKT